MPPAGTRSARFDWVFAAFFAASRPLLLSELKIKFYRLRLASYPASAGADEGHLI